MGDIADILGYAGKPVQDEATKILLDRPKNYGQPKPAKKPKGMSREVYDLIGNDAIAPAMQPNNVGPSFKNKRSTVLKGKWIWDVIRNSAREDSKLALYHWVKADMHYSDYPYAKFNVRLDDLTISREEYDALRLQDPLWTYEDTVALMQTSTRYDLRWPVVFDKLVLSVPKRVEELQARYYHVSAELHAAATQEPNDSTAMDTAPTDPTQQPPSSSGFGVSKSKFNLELETARRKAQDQLFRKTREDEAEEVRLREELRSIDASLRKLKKLAKPPAPIKKEPAPAAASSAADPKAAVKAGSSGLVPMDVPPMAAASSALAPAQVAAVQLPEAGRPCLQSTRLFSVDPSMGAAGAALSKNLIRKATGYLAEVGLPPKPMPTRAVCDLVDAIRRDTVALLSLHNAINKREKSLSAAAAAAMGISAGPSVSAGGGATVKAEKASKAKSSSTAADAAGGGEPTKPKKAAGTKRKSAAVAVDEGAGATGDAAAAEQKGGTKKAAKTDKSS